MPKASFVPSEAPKIGGSFSLFSAPSTTEVKTPPLNLFPNQTISEPKSPLFDPPSAPEITKKKPSAEISFAPKLPVAAEPEKTTAKTSLFETSAPPGSFFNVGTPDEAKSTTPAFVP